MDTTRKLVSYALPADLAVVMDAWPKLSNPVKAGLVVMIKAALDDAYR